jgi:DNA-binding NarL/FixJ family response regulator
VLQACKGGLLVGDNISPIQVDGARARRQLAETPERAEEIHLNAASDVISKIADGFIAVIESRTFIRECIRRSMQSAFRFQIQTFSEPTELLQKDGHLPSLILFSDNDRVPSVSVFEILARVAPRIPIIVLAYNNDAEMAKTAICNGAKGYIPVTLRFDIAIEAVRFVLAGGTYVPVDYLLMSSLPRDPSEAPPATGAVTARELAVVRAIQRGKSNKVIAYELGMCESTVKVHVRRVMKKLKAKNRTDVAIKLQSILGAAPRANTCIEFLA